MMYRAVHPGEVGTTTFTFARGSPQSNAITAGEYTSMAYDMPPMQQPARRPQVRNKVVCCLTCKYCQSEVCYRGMRAILLADMNVELFSTDSAPRNIQLVNDDYTTSNCDCRIKDLACLGCGQEIGYHVIQPCEMCLNSGAFVRACVG
jgi:hypothetical protein